MLCITLREQIDRVDGICKQNHFLYWRDKSAVPKLLKPAEQWDMQEKFPC